MIPTFKEGLTVLHKTRDKRVIGLLILAVLDFLNLVSQEMILFLHGLRVKLSLFDLTLKFTDTFVMVFLY